ncbi:MAG: hypothetical protein ACT4OP_13275, partial [Actinomycetota bacterium]
MKWSLAGLWVVLVIAGVIIVIATWLVARLAAGRALEPLRRLAATADQDLERQRRFVADASHELRNP